MVGKAAAFLFKFTKPNGIYSMKGTKTGIALLIMGGIPCQVDGMVPTIQNEEERKLCPFEDELNGSESSEQVYKLVKNRLELEG